MGEQDWFQRTTWSFYSPEQTRKPVWRTLFHQAGLDPARFNCTKLPWLYNGETRPNRPNGGINSSGLKKNPWIALGFLKWAVFGFLWMAFKVIVRLLVCVCVWERERTLGEKYLLMRWDLCLKPGILFASVSPFSFFLFCNQDCHCFSTSSFH